MNPVLQRHTDELLQQLQQQFAATNAPQRQFACWEYRAGSWSAPRCTIVKVEVNPEGTNRRAILTNRPGGAILPGGTYDECADRGESENRHKEIKRELHGDRLSDHRFILTKDSPPKLIPPTEAVPVEALSGIHRRKYFNTRRRHNPLGEGHITTWRTRIIKVAAEVVAATRRIVA
jgi:hypothetical protein